ncbi:hypothetical protein JYU34_006199 [Plutella xylostella]|uniref:Uncharacterized protein n=1 Tax=Plutella xylostella TaxID=51655 RepID=A0ABQ7QV60_PLUXY|nr:hypothetical protein JYU34_006199 [Plutella xylostella]
MFESLLQFFQSELQELYKWSKCGDGALSAVPTLLWALGAAALSQRILDGLFRRFLFRRVPLWEVVLQQLLFVWMVIYSLHFWVFSVRIIKVLIDYFLDDVSYIHLYNQMQIRPLTEAEVQSRKTITQWVIWFCGVVPVAVYIQTRPRRAPPPLMIWITANPWHRREMGPYGYYLHRPLSSLQSHTALGTRAPAPALRRAYSDSKIVIQEPSKKKRYSKSV